MHTENKIFELLLYNLNDLLYEFLINVPGSKEKLGQRRSYIVSVV